MKYICNMGNYNFREDIITGEKGEQVVREDLELEGMKFISNNKDNKYDLLMSLPSGKEITVEVKTDELCIPAKVVETPFGFVNVAAHDFGNIYIEIECRGKPSGISVSKATWFATHFKYYNEIWYIKTKELVDLIANNDFEIKEQSGDEGSNTKGYLIPRENYKEHFKIRKPNE